MSEDRFAKNYSNTWKNKTRSGMYHAENTNFDNRDYKHNLQSVVSPTGISYGQRPRLIPNRKRSMNKYRMLLQEYEAEMIERAGMAT